MHSTSRPRTPCVEGLVIATYDPATGLYRVEGQGNYNSMSFSHMWMAARIGCVVAGELGDRESTHTERVGSVRHSA